MAVGFESQREVPAVLLAVARLTHRTQRHHLEPRLGVRRIARALEREVELGAGEHRFRRSGRRVEEAEPRQARAKLHRRLCRRRLVDAVDRGHAGAHEASGHGAVRREHRVLDRSVRIVPLGHRGIGGEAVFVEHESCLGEVEFERAIPRTFGAEPRRDALQCPQ